MRPVTDTRATLGEGPIWLGEKLAWVDIIEKRVYVYNPETGEERRYQLDEMVGTVVPRESGGFVVALEKGMAFLDDETGAVETISGARATSSGTRFNDGKCDPAGRFWAGTMGLGGEPGMGALYVLHPDGRFEKKVEPVTISNGICWRADAEVMYYIDTPTQQVVAYEFDNATGAISNPRAVVEIDPSEGGPDGMAIDADGNLWIALWGGSAVVCHDPETGKRLHKIEVPASRVTACAFGGADLQDLYITTARVGLSPEELEEQPLAGSLFITRAPVRGVPSFSFAG